MHLMIRGTIIFYFVTTCAYLLNFTYPLGSRQITKYHIYKLSSLIVFKYLLLIRTIFIELFVVEVNKLSSVMLVDKGKFLSVLEICTVQLKQILCSVLFE